MNPLAIVVLLIVGWEGDHFHNIGIYFDVQVGISLFLRVHFRDLFNLIVVHCIKKKIHATLLVDRMQGQQHFLQDSFQCLKN